MTPELVFILHTLCWGYKVEPNFALAVAHVESGDKHHEFRMGRLGHSPYYGPFGIHRDFLKRWRIDDPEINCLVGVRALRNTQTLEAKKRRLKKYNTEFSEEYWKSVVAAYKKYKRKEVLDNIRESCNK